MEKDAVKYLFFKDVIADMVKAIEGGALTGAFTLSFCCIDYLGFGMYPWRKKNEKKDFIIFVKEYMGDFDQRYSKYAEYIYSARCSFIHSFSQSKSEENLGVNLIYMFADNGPNEPYHLKESVVKNKKSIFIVLVDLLTDIIASASYFFNGIDNPEQIKKWYDEIYHVFSPKLLISENLGRINFYYKDLHPILRVIDDDPDPISFRHSLRNSINNIVSNWL